MAQKIKGYSLDKPAVATPLGKPSALVIPQTPKYQTDTGHSLAILIDRPLVDIPNRGSHSGLCSVIDTDLYIRHSFHLGSLS